MNLTTPPLAPKVIAALAALNILTRQDLQNMNPCQAFLLLKKGGLSVTKSVFWQLVAVCCLKNVSDLSVSEREYWQQQLQQMPPVALFPVREVCESFMRLALVQATLAAQCGEVPVGAVVVHHGEVIAAAHNCCVTNCDISHHAEIVALSRAGRVLGNYRLNECDVYVSLEPCTMCASALIQARVARVIFAASEPKMGAAGSVLNLFVQSKLNTHTAVLGGVLAQEAQQIMRTFFRQRREQLVNNKCGSNDANHRVETC